MAVVVILPKQGQSVESCIITEIKKKKGDTVKKGEVLFSYETDKASFEEESPVDGVVLESFYSDGDEVPVLLDMMVIGQPGDDYAGLLQGGAPIVESQEPRAKIQEAETTAEPKPETRNPKRQTLQTFQTVQRLLFLLAPKILQPPKPLTLRNWPARDQMVV